MSNLVLARKPEVSSGPFRVGSSISFSYRSDISLGRNEMISFGASNAGTTWVTVGGPGQDPVTTNLLDEIAELKQRIATLEQAIDVIDELDIEVALERARTFFENKRGQSVYPDELARAIGTSVSQAVEVCDLLEKEGEIAGR